MERAIETTAGTPTLARSSVAVAFGEVATVGLVVAVFAVLGMLYVRLAPMFAKPDERYHFAYAVHLRQQGNLPVVDLGRTGLGGRPADEPEAHQPPLYYLLAVALASGRPLAGELSYPDNPHFLTTPTGNRVPFVLSTDPAAVPAYLSLYQAGRYLALAFGAASLVFGYLALRTFLPAGIAAAGVALVAFNPQYLYISTSFSNDVPSVALVNLGLWLLLRGWRRELSPAWAIASGAAVGLATLTKLSGLGLLVPFACVFALFARRERSLRPLRLAVPFALALLALTGWWFWRNETLYHDPFAVVTLAALLGPRPEPPNLAWLSYLLRYLWKAYWLDFSPGTMGFAERQVYWGLAGLSLLGLGGTAAACRRQRSLRVPVGLLLGWGVLVFGWLLRLTSQTDIVMGGGRLLFPVSLTVGALLAIGLAELGPGRARALVPGVTALGLLAFSTIAIDRYIVRPMPVAVASAELPAAPRHQTHAAIGDAVQLAGYDLEQMAPSGSLRVTYYWQARQAVRTNYTVFLQEIVHSPDGNDRVLSQLDSYPAYGSSPTGLWRPGEFVVDRFELPLKRPPEPLRPDQTLLVVTGLYDFRTMERLRIGERGPAARSLYDQAIVVAQLDPADLHPLPPPPNENACLDRLSLPAA